MKIKEILDSVENLSNGRNYWFVRTEYGKHFDQFYEGNFIGIGWGYITLRDFKNLSSSQIRSKIAKKELLDDSDSKQKGKITAIYNKLERFLKLKKGDIIVVPSRKSQRLAFGEIQDDNNYEEGNSKDSFAKRRNVKWIENKSIFDLDPYFFRLKINQHSISDINSFAPYIDKEVGSLFKRGEKIHYVLTIEKKDDINFKTLSGLLENIENILKDINKDLKFNEDEDEFFVKMNLQSPGKIEIIRDGKSLAILSYLLFVTSCGGADKINDANLKQVYDRNSVKLEKTIKQLDSLDINRDHMIEPFVDKNGK